MRESDYKYFTILKEAMALKYRSAHPHSAKSLEEFKGQDIVNFQEHLALETNGRISEKWFYTHIKSETGKLPRIDILNMLSQYAGFKDWESFLGEKIQPEKAEKEVLIKKGLKKWQWLIAAGLGTFVLISLAYTTIQQSTYVFCFVDADDNSPIEQEINIWLLNQGESPQILATDEKGCLSLDLAKGQVKLVIKSPYYQQDTILRNLTSQNKPEEIRLKKDDYALMIHYFSTANLDDWKKRRKQLGEMIADQARIFQVFGPNQEGMEMYNKEEFINKMTMPLKSLRNIEILETIYDNEEEQIVSMRFMQKDQ